MIELISYSRFGGLRLADFLSPEAEVVEFGDWEFMDDLWVGESVGGFTEFLRLAEDPDVVRSVALDFTTLPTESAAAILHAIGLPLAPGMSEPMVTALLGSPDFVEQFPAAPDRRTLYFPCGAREPYRVSCTVHQADGLIYAVVMAPTPRRQATDRSSPEA